jgi:hypothetical protein
VTACSLEPGCGDAEPATRCTTGLTAHMRPWNGRLRMGAEKLRKLLLVQQAAASGEQPDRLQLHKEG